MSTQAGIQSIDRRKTSTENDRIQGLGGSRTHQNVALTDIISEGPIEGLVEGGSSIFLNGDPLFAEGEAPFIPLDSVTASGSSGANTITLNSSTSQTKGEEDLFIGISEAINTSVSMSSPNHIATNPFAGVSGFTCTLTASSPVFSADMVHTPSAHSNISAANLDHGDGIVYLTLNNGNVLIGFISAFTSSTVVTFTTNHVSDYTLYVTTADTALSNSHPVRIDLYYKVSNISGTTVTLTGNLNTTFSAKNVIYQTTTVNSDPASKKYPGSTYQFRTGTENQAVINSVNGEGSSTIGLTLPSGALTKNTAKTITPANLTGGQKTEVDTVNFIITYPSGLYFYDESNGDEYRCGAAYRVELGIQRPGGSMVFEALGGNNSPSQRVSGIGNTGESLVAHDALKKSAITFEYRIDMTPYQPFSDFAVRVTRLTNHGTTDDGVDYTRGVRGLHRGAKALETLNEAKFKMVGQATITAATAVIKEKLNYPFTAVANVGFSSKSFANVPKRSYEVKGLKIQVPSNYVTRDENVGETTYPGQVATYKRNVSTQAIETTNQAWDGNFRNKKVYSNNPAWVFYDILTNNRYGLGLWLSELDIDKYALYKIGKYCDELVPDGKGGKEPRFTANLYLQKATDAYKVLKDMATIFRGMLYWMDSQLTPIIDEKKEPVYSFSKANVIEGQFEYEGTGSRTRANQYVVSWNNPDSQYKLEPLVVEDRRNIAQTGKIIKETAVAFGCTSEGQALRYAKWKLWTAINQTEVVSFKTGVNASFLSPGDIITVTDDSDFSLPFSGRVSSYTESGGVKLTLDRDIDSFLPVSAHTYSVTVVVPKVAAVLNQDSATIGGVSYSRGDIITQARIVAGGSQTNLIVSSDTSAETNLKICNALDDSNNALSLLLNTSTIVEERTLTGTATVGGVSVQVPAAAVDGKSTLQLASALNEEAVSDLTEAIWAIKQIQTSTGAKTLGSAKEYKVLGVIEEENSIYGISAVEHYNQKFDSIEETFKVAVVDPVFPPEPDTTPPEPTKLRILRVPIRHREGEEIRVEWDAPSSYDHIKGFALTHNFNTDFEFEEIFIRGGTSLSKVFTGLRDGVYQVSVRTVSGFDKRSKPVTQNIEIVDIFGGGDRFRGILRGGSSSSPLDMNRTSGKVFFKKSAYRISPLVAAQAGVGDSGTETVKANNSTNAASISQTVTALASGSWPGYKNENDTRTGQLFYDYSNADHASNDPIRLIAWRRDDTLDIDYWYDADKFIADANSIWTNLSGTVAVAADSNKVVGTNTTFTSLDITRILKFSSTQAAKIAFIESDTVLYLDRTFSTQVSSGTTAAADELAVDFANDFLLGEVSFKTGTNYALKPYITVNELLANNLRAVIATPNVSSLMYGSDGAVKTDFDNITLKVQTVGFEAPKIKVNGAGFSQTDQSAQTSFSAIASEPHSVTLHSAANDGANPITFAGGALVFTVTIQETEDTTITATETVTITKAQEEAASGATRTAAGYLYYQTQQANAPSAPSASGVAYNWSTGLFNTGGVIGTGGTQWNQIAPTPTTGATDKMWYIYYSVVQASSSDSTSTPTFGTVVYQATNFTGLVRFTGTGSSPSVSDGAGGTLSFGSSGTTLIDGGNITTGTIKSDGVQVGGSSSFTADGSAFTSAGTYFNLDNGSIGSQNFRIQSNGNAHFAGDLIVGGTTLTTTNTLNANTTKSDVGLGQVEDGNHSAQVQGAFTDEVTISGGKIIVSSETAGSIELNSATKQILIKDGSTTRVLIGKLST